MPKRKQQKGDNELLAQAESNSDKTKNRRKRRESVASISESVEGMEGLDVVSESVSSQQGSQESGIEREVLVEQSTSTVEGIEERIKAEVSEIETMRDEVDESMSEGGVDEGEREKRSGEIERKGEDGEEEVAESIEVSGKYEQSKYEQSIPVVEAQESTHTLEQVSYVERSPESPESEEASVSRPPQKKKFIPYRLRELIIEDDDVAHRIGKYILLNKVSMKTIGELIKIAYDIGIEDPSGMRRQELISAILAGAYTDYDIRLYAEGVFQMIESGSGFIRFSHNNFLPSNEDVFVSKTLIKKYGIRTGDIVAGEIRPPRDEKDRYFSLHTVDKINFVDPRKSRERTLFENLIPYYPTKKFELDFQIDKDISCRVVDIIAPIGKGQRGLIVSPPRAGKTMLLQNIARAILENHPDVIMIILLIDERPEEVTDWKRNIVEKYAKSRRVEVAAATFDEKPETHIRVAEIVLSEAKRLVEYKHDVVIFLDSITRLTRAYNQYIPSSGKVLTGGIDSAALQFPKKFFGAARAIEGGGSLTILATCLIDTGSRMDEVIFEEFKGTGNMEIYLDRRISERRIFPAIDIHRSGTRKEELLIPPEFLPKVWLLRKSLQPITAVEAMELLYERMIKTKNNTELFELMLSS